MTQGETVKRPDVERLRSLAETATPGPWRSMRDGNQYVEAEGEQNELTPGMRLVGASRIEELPRAYNPHSEKAFGPKPGVTRFTDADADFIASANPERVLALCDYVEHLELALRINLNDWVWVKLTDEGKAALESNPARRMIAERMPQALRQVEDVMRFQLWDLMNIFGPHMYNGAPVLFEGMCVHFKDPEKQEIL